MVKAGLGLGGLGKTLGGVVAATVGYNAAQALQALLRSKACQLEEQLRATEAALSAQEACSLEGLQAKRSLESQCEGLRHQLGELRHQLAQTQDQLQEAELRTAHLEQQQEEAQVAWQTQQAEHACIIASRNAAIGKVRALEVQVAALQSEKVHVNQALTGKSTQLADAVQQISVLQEELVQQNCSLQQLEAQHTDILAAQTAQLHADSTRINTLEALAGSLRQDLLQSQVQSREEVATLVQAHATLKDELALVKQHSMTLKGQLAAANTSLQQQQESTKRALAAKNKELSKAATSLKALQNSLDVTTREMEASHQREAEADTRAREGHKNLAAVIGQLQCLQGPESRRCSAYSTTSSVPSALEDAWVVDSSSSFGSGEGSSARHSSNNSSSSHSHSMSDDGSDLQAAAASLEWVEERLAKAQRQSTELLDAHAQLTRQSETLAVERQQAQQMAEQLAAAHRQQTVQLQQNQQEAVAAQERAATEHLQLQQQVHNLRQELESSQDLAQWFQQQQSQYEQRCTELQHELQKSKQQQQQQQQQHQQQAPMTDAALQGQLVVFYTALHVCLSSVRPANILNLNPIMSKERVGAVAVNTGAIAALEYLCGLQGPRGDSAACFLDRCKLEDPLERMVSAGFSVPAALHALVECWEQLQDQQQQQMANVVGRQAVVAAATQPRFANVAALQRSFGKLSLLNMDSVSCGLNSLVQCFSRTTIVSALLALADPDDPKCDSLVVCKAAAAMKDVEAALTSSNSSPVDLRALRHAICHAAGKAVGQQHEVQVYLEHLLKALQRRAEDNEWHKERGSGTAGDPVDDAMGCCLQLFGHCSHCGHKGPAFGLKWQHHLKVGVSVETASWTLEQHLLHSMAGDDDYVEHNKDLGMCQKCGGLQRLGCELLHCPQALAVSVELHDGVAPLEYTKSLQQQVDVRRWLHLSPAAAAGTSTTYELAAVIAHSGSGSSGHYVAPVKGQGDSWVVMDDARRPSSAQPWAVVAADLAGARKEFKPALLVYRRCQQQHSQMQPAVQHRQQQHAPKQLQPAQHQQQQKVFQQRVKGPGRRS